MSDSEEGDLNVKCKLQEKERLWTTVMSTLVVCIMSFMMGCTLGYSSPVLLELESQEDPELRFNSFLSGLFGASSLVGGVFGGPIAGWVADKWGRKISLVLCGLPYVLGYFLIVLASATATPIAFKALLLAGRFITGIGMGWTFLTAPVYIGEISSAKLRGALGSFSEVALAGGIIFVYAIGLIPTFRYYHIALVLEGVVLLYMFLVVWLPETPRWLLVKQQRKEAMKVMLLLRGPKATNQIKEEMDDIKKILSETPHFTFFQTLKELAKKSVLIPAVIASIVLVILEFTGGASTVTAYAASIFREAGVKQPDLVGAFAIGGTQFIATAVGACTMDLLGRKILLLVSAAGMLVGSATLGTHFYITRPALCANSTNATILLSDSTTLVCNSHFAPLAIASLVLYIAAFGIGWGPVPWVIMSEYLPLRVKGTGTAIIVTGSWISAVVVTGAYPVYAEHVNPWFAWWTFSVINLLAIVFVAVFIVETKGKTLEDIQRHFEQKYSKRKAISFSLSQTALSEENLDVANETLDDEHPIITPL